MWRQGGHITGRVRVYSLQYVHQISVWIHAVQLAGADQAPTTSYGRIVVTLPLSPDGRQRKPIAARYSNERRNERKEAELSKQGKATHYAGVHLGHEL